MKYVNGDPEQHKALSQIFREHSDEGREEIRALMDAEDFENLLYVIHSLKSKALAIGAVELSQQAATMEEHLRRGDTQYAQEAVSLLMFTWERVIAGLKEVETCLES